MKIKAAILSEMGLERPYASSKPLRIEEIDLEGPGPEDVLVRIVSAGLCHSDLSVIEGNRPRPLPMALGHEASGVVEEVGKQVRRFEKGDHVVFQFLPTCGHCIPCATGRPALCEPGGKANTDGTLLDGTIHLQRQGEKLYHHLGVSGFSEYVVASQNSIVKINKDYPLDVAAVFGCAILTGVGAVINTGQFKAGQTVLVVGLGGVGQSAVLGAKAAGASRIIAADISGSKRELAKELGADEVIDSAADGALEQVREMTKGGVDLSVEFAGAMPALEFAYYATKRGGTTVTGALPHPDKKFSIPAADLVAMEKSIKGCYLGSSVPARDIPRYLELYAQGLLPVEKLVTHRLRLEEINEGFERLAAGKALRQLIEF